MDVDCAVAVTPYGSISLVRAAQCFVNGGGQCPYPGELPHAALLALPRQEHHQQRLGCPKIMSLQVGLEPELGAVQMGSRTLKLDRVQLAASVRRLDMDPCVRKMRRSFPRIEIQSVAQLQEQVLTGQPRP